MAAVTNGSVYWEPKSLRSDEEYILLVHSRSSPNAAQGMSQSISIVTNSSSLAVPSHEAHAIEEVQRKQKVRLANITGHMDSTIGVGVHNSNFEGSFSENISLASPFLNFGVMGQELESDFYIPNLLDYTVKLDGRTVPFYTKVASPNTLKGKRADFSLFSTSKNQFDLFVDKSVFYKQESLTAYAQSYLGDLHSCLERVIPDTLQTLGPIPYDLDGRAELNILLANLSSSTEKNSIGLFSDVDRFTRHGRDPIPDSNRGEVIYLQQGSRPGILCSTTAHELTHLISYDSKVLSQIPESKRDDIREAFSRKLRGELLGLDEGLAHIVEDISGEESMVIEKTNMALTQLNGSTFYLEATWDNPYASIRSRGLNVLLLYHALHQTGGRLSRNDKTTTNFLRNIIRSKETGYGNIAKQIGMSESDLFKSFFTSLFISLYHPNESLGFIDDPVEEDGVLRGVHILNRDTPVPEIPYSLDAVHPFQVLLPALGSSESYHLPAGGIVAYRYLTPQSLSSHVKFQINGGGAPFDFYMIRVK